MPLGTHSPPWPASSMVGPKKRPGTFAAKQQKRLNRPLSAERAASIAQKVGKLPRQTVSRAWEPEPMRRERETKGSGAAALQSHEKRLRALNKRLRQIEALQELEASGGALDEQQLSKVERLDETLKEMEELMGG